MSDSLWPHGLQHARPPCSSPTPRVYSNSCPVSRGCHPTISSSVVPFSSCFQSFPASGSFQMSQFFTSSGQSTGHSASTSVLPMNTQDWFPLGWTGWISLQSKGLSRVFSNTTVQKHQFFCTQLSLQSNSHIYTQLLEKPQLWLDRPLDSRVIENQEDPRCQCEAYQAEYSLILGRWDFCSAQALTSWMRPTHITKVQSALLSLQIQILILSKNILRETPRIMLDHIYWHPVAQSNWCKKLTITLWFYSSKVSHSFPVLILTTIISV